MGAEQFRTEAKGKTAQEAFNAAKEEAYYDYGHAGYTGTIAEKDSFVMAKTQGKLGAAYRIADAIEDGESWVHPDDCRAYDDKWGPALCLQIAEDEWLFFGIASS